MEWTSTVLRLSYSICTLFLCIAIPGISQNDTVPNEWHGSGLSVVRITGDQIWIQHAGNNLGVYQYSQTDDHTLHIHTFLDEGTLPRPCDIVMHISGEDSVTIIYPATQQTVTFYKPGTLHARKAFELHTFTYRVTSSAFQTPKTDLVITANGELFFKSVYPPQMQYTGELTAVQLDTFMQLIDEIDIVNIESAAAWPTQCLDDDVHFYFADVDGSVKKYVSQHTPYRLRNLRSFCDMLIHDIK